MNAKYWPCDCANLAHATITETPNGFPRSAASAAARSQAAPPCSWHAGSAESSKDRIEIAEVRKHSASISVVFVSVPSTSTMARFIGALRRLTCLRFTGANRTPHSIELETQQGAVGVR